MSREHGGKTRPRQIAVATASGEPFPPNSHELVVIPTEPPAVARDAIVGAVPPDHARQAGVLLAKRAVQVSPAPFAHGGQGARVTVFRRYLAHHVLASQRLALDVGEAEKVEGRPTCRGMTPFRASEPEVHEARLDWVERKPEPLKSLTQYG